MTVVISQRSKPASPSRYIRFHIDSVNLTSPVRPATQNARAYVRVRIVNRNDRVETGTHLGHPHLACWKEDLAVLILEQTSQVTFQLKQHSAWKASSSQIAVTDAYPLSHLFEMQCKTGSLTSYIAIPLHRKQSKFDATKCEVGTIRVIVSALSAVEVANLSLEGAVQSVNQFKKSTLSIKRASQYRAGDAILEPILGILDIVTSFLALSPEPISSAVIGLAHGVAKTVKTQIAQDADVISLPKTIQDIHPLNMALGDLVLALKDCTDFMIKFCKSRFLGRVVRNPEKAQQLKELQRRLTKMAQNVQQTLLLDIALKQAGLGIEWDHLRTKQLMARLTRIEMSVPTQPKGNDGQHLVTLTSIRSWATSPLQDGKNVLWLRSPTESSESVAQIVATLFHEFKLAHQLRGSVFFSSSSSPRDSDDRFLQLIKGGNNFPHYRLPKALASDLEYPPIREDIARRLEENPYIEHRRLEDQFEQLVLQPLLAHAPAPARPILFLLDGFDRHGTGQEEDEMCAECDAFEDVLRVLIEGWVRCPHNVRLLISSAECEPLRKLLGGCQNVLGLEVPAIESNRAKGLVV
ncbi:hypothetical protein B0H16DRAFT_1730592 [Mycena metata]|uniref:C2 domain-containing protein n=1 Tax=Mycena metata TaxID=1033252 RepID=A0AAD7I7I9_9AGAR|nr:hypothetical protein B0H16DRAFT_1730592 [Mycena metata]